MGIRESALSTLSALTNNDFVRMVSSAGASRKISLQAIAQHIIEQYAGSSLAGSNQSVKAAIDGLNSTLALLPNTQVLYMSSGGKSKFRIMTNVASGEHVATVFMVGKNVNSFVMRTGTGTNYNVFRSVAGDATATFIQDGNNRGFEVTTGSYQGYSFYINTGDADTTVTIETV